MKKQIILQVGNLYWWNKKILCEYKGYNKGHVFVTTNGGHISLKEKDLNQISED